MRWMVAGLALLVAGCGEKVDSEVSAVFEGDLQKGTVIMTCRSSSTGTCHAMFVLKDEVIRIEAAAGSIATATGINDLFSYCVGAEAPGDGCTLRPVADGEQIVRHRATHR